GLVVVEAGTAAAGVSGVASFISSLRHAATVAARRRLDMTRVLAVLVALSCLVFACVALPIARQARHEPVYTRAALHGLVDREPARWLGRTLLVQGEAIATSCVERAGTLILCAPPRVFLTDPGPSLAVRPLLPLVSASPDPWLTAVRRLPLIGRF